MLFHSPVSVASRPSIFSTFLTGSTPSMLTLLGQWSMKIQQTNMPCHRIWLSAKVFGSRCLIGYCISPLTFSSFVFSIILSCAALRIATMLGRTIDKVQQANKPIYGIMTCGHYLFLNFENQADGVYRFTQMKWHRNRKTFPRWGALFMIRL